MNKNKIILILSIILIIPLLFLAGAIPYAKLNLELVFKMNICDSLESNSEEECNCLDDVYNLSKNRFRLFWGRLVYNEDKFVEPEEFEVYRDICLFIKSANEEIKTVKENTLNKFYCTTERYISQDGTGFCGYSEDYSNEYGGLYKINGKWINIDWLEESNNTVSKRNDGDK